MSGRGVAILGATGSIGRQALDVIDRHPDRFHLTGLLSKSRSAGREAAHVVTAGDPDSGARVEAMVTDPATDIVLVAIAGAAALAPVLTALRAGKIVALATKEVLVMAGALVMAEAGNRMHPVDSEHSAIWQCLWGESPASLSRILLTASGGPFWSRPEIDLGAITVAEALAHPRWEMGPKITIDSATMMNKGLELIEAHHLFHVPLERIEVVVHPQSVVHSMVEFVDGSLKAQLGNPDMRLPIAVALAYPDRLPGAVAPTEPADLGSLEFARLDGDRFPAVALARAAAAAGGTLPAVLNAANEEVVDAFLKGAIRFNDIVPLVEAAMAADPGRGAGLPEILDADRRARDYVRKKAGNK